MIILLSVLLVWLLSRSAVAMDAAQTAAHLFAASVLPGLLPYMTLALMLTSHLPTACPDWLLMLVGWCGGSPAGAQLIALRPDLPRDRQRQLAVACATMSPMFLIGVIPVWLHAPAVGVRLLAASLVGAFLTACCAKKLSTAYPTAADCSAAPKPLSFAEALTRAAETMLVVCGTMMLLRVLAALAGEFLHGLPAAQLLLTTLLEVAGGTAAIASLPCALSLRVALIAAATGFGGCAILLQNRAAYPEGLFPVGEQLCWQLLHGVLSGLIAYGLMCLPVV